VRSVVPCREQDGVLRGLVGETACPLASTRTSSLGLVSSPLGLVSSPLGLVSSPLALVSPHAPEWFWEWVPQSQRSLDALDRGELCVSKVVLRWSAFYRKRRRTSRQPPIPCRRCHRRRLLENGGKWFWEWVPESQGRLETEALEKLCVSRVVLRWSAFYRKRRRTWLRPPIPCRKYHRTRLIEK
jgi:hypothetical protein